MKYLIIFIYTLLFAIDGINIYNIPSIKNDNIYNLESKISDKNITIMEKFFPSSIKTIKPKLDIAILIDKKLFKKYLPSIINSINSYLLYKNIEYNLTIYDINETKNAIKHKNILVYTFNPTKIYQFINFSNNFYFPMINKNEINFQKNNFYFGGIDFKQQIKNLSILIHKNKIIAINDNTLTSSYLSSIQLSFFKKIIFYKTNFINYNKLNNSYIFLNTAPNKSAQILSNIYYKNIKPILILSTQINYTPKLISLTQSEALKKVVIANSIIKYPKELADINQLLNSDIRFNYVNFAATILCNKIYNFYSYYMNDFYLYMFNNQINYKTKLYQIVFRGFKPIYLNNLL